VKAAERRTIGAGPAERLSAYLQVLTQARKMGKERISSKEISAYTSINASQIRRDLSAFGKFGKRGVGYSVDHLHGVIGEILLRQGEHGIALVGAGRLGQAIASSPIFAEQGITIAAIFDRDPARVAGVLAVPAASAQQAASELVEAGVRIIFNYSEALLDLPPEVQVLTSNPAAQLLAALALRG
jgi:redox-sensing transcriptional repressor